MFWSIYMKSKSKLEKFLMSRFWRRSTRYFHRACGFSDKCLGLIIWCQEPISAIKTHRITPVGLKRRQFLGLAFAVKTTTPTSPLFRRKVQPKPPTWGMNATGQDIVQRPAQLTESNSSYCLSSPRTSP